MKCILHECSVAQLHAVASGDSVVRVWYECAQLQLQASKYFAKMAGAVVGSIAEPPAECSNLLFAYLPGLVCTKMCCCGP